MADDVQHTISDGLTYYVQYHQFHALRKTRLCYAHVTPTRLELVTQALKVPCATSCATESELNYSIVYRV